MSKGRELIPFSPEDRRQKIRLKNLSSIREVQMVLRAGIYEDHMPELVAVIERATSGQWFWYCSQQIDWVQSPGTDLSTAARVKNWVATMLDQNWPTDFTGWFISEVDADIAIKLLQPYTTE